MRLDELMRTTKFARISKGCANDCHVVSLDAVYSNIN